MLNDLLATTAIGLILAAVVGVFLARRALSPLQRTLRLQRQFIADASHELRTPLTLLHTRVQLLNRGLPSDTIGNDIRREVAAVVQDSSRLTELLEDLLLAADGETTGAAEVHVGPLVAEVAAAATPYANERGVRLVHEPSDATARASAPAVRRALTALVDNAIEHTPPAGSVTISLRNTSSVVTLRVKDTGTGISPDDAAALIARFHSGGRRAGRRHYGLGLALVSDIADRYGGRLDIDGWSGHGATVSLSLPAGAS